jgi:hypothetical protein
LEVELPNESAVPERSVIDCPAAAPEGAMRAVRDRHLLSIAVFGPVVAYSLALIERKWALLLGSGSLSAAPPLSWPDRIAFVTIIAAEILIALLAFTRLASIVVGRAAATAIAAATWVFAVSMEYSVLRYFTDGIDLALMRRLSGGSALAALAYVGPEVLAYVSFAGALLLVALVSAAVMRSRLARFVAAGPAISSKMLACSGAGVVLVSVIVPIASPDLHHALWRTLPHRVLAASTSFLTDFDRDGYGLVDVPLDSAPLDSSRHPYAAEVPGNGMDENGVGGDLTAVNALRPPADWSGVRLKPKNVLVIVLDSARSDLLDARVDDAEVMPVLRRLPGGPIQIVSHAGYSASSGMALFDQTMGDAESRIPLAARFKALGYATGAFSGQDEDAVIHTAFSGADVFVDAAAYKARRMHATTLPAGIGIPAPLVTERFQAWLDSLPPGRPFFAYLNWQETHFPYDYDGCPRLFPGVPVPRRSITPANREWVRRTYLNAAAVLDRMLRTVADDLRSRDRFENTLMVVMGDHGEEFFDHGCLGHGVSVTLEQNMALGKLVNSDYQPPAGLPIGLAEMGDVIYNALAWSEADRVPLAGRALCHVGNLAKPRQVGLVGPGGLVKYDFFTGKWSRQRRIGEPLVPAPADPDVIHLWESTVVRLAASQGTLP